MSSRGYLVRILLNLEFNSENLKKILTRGIKKGFKYLTIEHGYQDNLDKIVHGIFYEDDYFLHMERGELEFRLFIQLIKSEDSNIYISLRPDDYVKFKLREEKSYYNFYYNISSLVFFLLELIEPFEILHLEAYREIEQDWPEEDDWLFVKSGSLE